jgi:hypothetical protein
MQHFGQIVFLQLGWRAMGLTLRAYCIMATTHGGAREGLDLQPGTRCTAVSLPGGVGAKTHALHGARGGLPGGGTLLKQGCI